MRRFTLTTMFVSTFTLLAVCGCNTERIYFWDSVEFVDHYFTPRFAAVDHDALMHMPYVTGATLTIHVAGKEDTDMSGWTVAVDDPDVLRIDEWSLDDEDRHSLDIAVTASGAGDTLLRALDASGDLVASTPISVASPDRVEIRPYGLSLVDDPDGVEDADAYALLVGGPTGFEVDWYRGDEFLFGTGALTLQADGGVSTAEPADLGSLIADVFVDMFFAEREEMTLTALEPGVHTVGLLCNGELVREIEVEGVEADEVDEILILAEPEHDARHGDLLHLVAQGYLADGEPVFGIDYTWDVFGEERIATTFSYHYDADLENTVEVGFDGLSDGLVIHGADEVDGNAAGCSVTGTPSCASAAATAALLALAALSLSLRLRRR